MCIARIFAIVWITAATAAQAAAGPEAFVRSFADRAVALATSETMTPGERQRQFEDLLRETFDLPRIQPTLIGPYWQLAGPRQRRAFIDAVNRLVPDTYMDRFYLRPGQRIVIDGHRREGDRVVVQGRIILGDGRPDIHLDWLMDGRGSGCRVVDMRVDGESMNDRRRREYMAIIRRDGGQVDALVDWLNRQLARDQREDD